MLRGGEVTSVASETGQVTPVPGGFLAHGKGLKMWLYLALGAPGLCDKVVELSSQTELQT